MIPHTKSDRNLPVFPTVAERIAERGASEFARAEKEQRAGFDRLVIEQSGIQRPHSHYFKPCPFSEVDVYRVLALFAVTDPCLQHAVKKLLVAGGRGAGKDISQDVKEAVDALARWQEMRAEEAAS